METSNVPPPKSKTRIVCSFSCLSNPYAKAAAVGSLMIRRTFSPAISPAFLVACLCASLKYAGTVMTAFFTVCPRYASASRLSFCRIMAEICSGVYSFPSMSTFSSVPIFLLMDLMVRDGSMIAWFLATWPTMISSSLTCTTLGVVLVPSAFGIIVGFPPSITATAEKVVPKSIPIVGPETLVFFCVSVIFIDPLIFYLLDRNLPFQQKIALCILSLYLLNQTLSQVEHLPLK